MKKIFSSIILSLIVISMLGFVNADIAIGINDCEGLQNMQSNLAGNYYLTNDIDCSDTINWNSGAGFVPIGEFAGTFDGQNYVINNLFINKPSADASGSFIGLFGYIVSGAEIKNVGLVNADITGNYMVGGLVGHIQYSGAITNSYVTGSVTSTSNYVGGLVGQNWFGTITNSYSTGSVTGNGYSVGGLVGESMGTITNCYATGSVTGIGNYVRALIGNNYIDWLDTHYGTVTNSYWDTETSGQSTSADGTGKTTEEMMKQSTFVNWDFSNIWEIDEGASYPYFYSGQNPIVPEFGAIVGVLTVLGALGVFFFVRKK